MHTSLPMGERKINFPTSKVMEVKDTDHTNHQSVKTMKEGGDIIFISVVPQLSMVV